MASESEPRFHRRSIVLTGHFQVDHRYHHRRPRGSADHLLFCCLDGAGFLASGTRRIRLEPSQVAIYPPGKAQDYGTDREPGRWDFLWVHFQPRPHWRGLLAWADGPSPAVYPVSDTALWRRIASALEQTHLLAIGSHRHAEALAANALEQALLWLAEASPNESRLDPRIRVACEHLHQQLHRKVSAAELARVARCSVSRLAHLFTAQLGCAPAAYQDGERLRRAAELLLHGELPIAAIAAQLGWHDPAYFSNRFRLRHGASPRAWRQQQRAADRRHDPVPIPGS